MHLLAASLVCKGSTWTPADSDLGPRFWQGAMHGSAVNAVSNTQGNENDAEPAVRKAMTAEIAKLEAAILR